MPRRAIPGKYGRITDAVACGPDTVIRIEVPSAKLGASAEVMADKATGKPRGFGFVVFEHISCVEAGAQGHGKFLCCDDSLQLKVPSEFTLKRLAATQDSHSKALVKLTEQRRHQQSNKNWSFVYRRM